MSVAKRKLEQNQIIRHLDPVDHVLLRPSMYIGGVSPAEHDVWILNDEEKLEFKKVTYVEGLLKICNEVIDNSIDEGIKTNWNYSTKIKVTVTKDTFICEDNGRGIPVMQDEEGNWLCVDAVCKPMTGSNFDDTPDKTTIGTNGIGCKGANIFSKKFECVTCDGQAKMKIECTDNCSTEKHSLLTANTKTGTTVSFTPDFARFGVKSFSEEIVTLLKTRLRFLSWFFPKCAISFNGEKISVRAKDFASMLPQPVVAINEPNAYICVYPSDEPYMLSYVNGLSLRTGGTHVDYILWKVIADIREKVAKKYKAIKPADIRNRLGIVVFLKGLPNLKFDSQTKEKITNSQGEITDFLRNNNIDLDAWTHKVVYTKPIIENITELFRLKEELAAKKELDSLNKTKKEVVSEKYFPPIAKSGQKFLMLTEGQSAFSGISPILGRKGIGYYMLRGKLKNILEEKATGKNGYMQNQEIRELVNILGLDLNGNTEDMPYDYVVILSDADPDGTAIAGLAITMFSKLAPKMLKAGRICRLNTPLMIGLKGDKVEEYFFKFPNSKDLKKNLNYFYLKGLGSWTKSRLNQVIEKEGGMEKLLVSFDLDENANKSIVDWFGLDSTARKEALRGREFHINNV